MMQKIVIYASKDKVPFVDMTNKCWHTRNRNDGTKHTNFENDYLKTIWVICKKMMSNMLSYYRYVALCCDVR
jgi:hypothetical protein